MIQKKQNQLFVVTVLLIISNTTITEPRVYRNEYSAEYPTHPIRVKLETRDLPNVNPTVTFVVKMDKDPNIMTWPYDIAGATALGAAVLATIFSDDKDKTSTAVKGVITLLIPLLPRFYNYVFSSFATEQAQKVSNDDQETDSCE